MKVQQGKNMKNFLYTQLQINEQKQEENAKNIKENEKKLKRIFTYIFGILMLIATSLLSLATLGYEIGFIICVMAAISMPGIIQDLRKDWKDIPTVDYYKEKQTLMIQHSLIEKAIQDAKKENLMKKPTNDVKTIGVISKLNLRLELVKQYLQDPYILEQYKHLGSVMTLGYNADQTQAFEDIIKEDIKIKKRGSL